MNMMSDFHWFVDHYYELFEKYGTCYLVIKDEKIYGSYEDFGTAVENAWKEHEPGTVSIQYCNGEESGYTAYLNGISPA